jgi:hypothetical protein
MKRDMNLVREILLWAENQEHGYVDTNPSIEGYTEEQIGYHVYLMYQAGLVNASDTTSMGDKSPNALLLALSWLGHEFLDAAKDETIWSKAKNTILKPTAGVAFDVLLEWLKTEARKKLGI